MKTFISLVCILLLASVGTLATGCATADPSSASNGIKMDSPTTTVTQNFIFLGTNALADALSGRIPVFGQQGEKIVTVVNVGVAGVYNRDSDAQQTTTPILQPVPLGDKPIQDMKDTATAIATNGGSTLLKAATEKVQSASSGTVSTASTAKTQEPVEPIPIDSTATANASGGGGK